MSLGGSVYEKWAVAVSAVAEYQGQAGTALIQATAGTDAATLESAGRDSSHALQALKHSHERTGKRLKIYGV